MKEYGATSLTVLHTRDHKVADSESFVAPLRSARGVWFPGGRQWRLADSYLGTRTERELRAVLDRGGVIGGTSAGATIQGSYLARGDTRNNTIMMGDHEVGFGYLRNVAIDQHLLRRNRQFDLIPVIEKHPQLLGIGIDESTAIVVRGDTAEVIGPSYVAVFDNHRIMGPGGRFYFLQNGDRLNLNTREPSRRSAIPAQWPVKQDWPRP
jgi:cyanophycinase